MNALRIFVVLMLAVSLTACGPTFPKEKLTGAIVELCKKEYGLNIEAKVVGKTLAVYLPLESLFDITFAINEKAQDNIQSILLSASRVSLSTDADIKFYVIIAQDIRLPEVQVIIMKYVDDVKRALYSDISRSEYIKRTIFDININPQSQKEEAVKHILAKYDFGPQWENDVMNEFFRSTPVNLKDIGYWQDKFYVKDITLPEFLAEQMAYRVKMLFRENKDLYETYVMKKMDGIYEKKGFGSDFKIDFDIQINEVLKVMGKAKDENLIFKNIFKEVSDTIHDYKFQDFTMVRITDVNTSRKLFVSKEDVEQYWKEKLSLDVVLDGISKFAGPVVSVK